MAMPAGRMRREPASSGRIEGVRCENPAGGQARGHSPARRTAGGTTSCHSSGLREWQTAPAARPIWWRSRMRRSRTSILVHGNRGPSHCNRLVRQTEQSHGSGHFAATRRNQQVALAPRKSIDAWRCGRGAQPSPMPVAAQQTAPTRLAGMRCRRLPEAAAVNGLAPGS